MGSVHFEKLCDVPAVPGYAPAATSVQDDGALLFLLIEQSGADAIFAYDAAPSGVRFARTNMESPKRFRLVMWKAGVSHVIDLPELDVTFPLVDLLADGRVLIVGSRCAWYGEGEHDLNGIIVDPAIGRMSRILLGDGISSVQVDARNRIWVSYFDEGIYGNFGWGGDGPLPVGAAGLVCFRETGEKVWEFPDGIDDCYALNVSDGGAAAYFYSDLPICRISADFELTYWKTKLSGCRALAITRSRVLMSGQYDDPPDVGYLATLGDGALDDVQQVQLLLPDGTGIPQRHLMARGPHLYFFDTATAYRATLE